MLNPRILSLRKFSGKFLPKWPRMLECFGFPSSKTCSSRSITFDLSVPALPWPALFPGFVFDPVHLYNVKYQ